MWAKFKAEFSLAAVVTTFFGVGLVVLTVFLVKEAYTALNPATTTTPKTT